MRVRDWVGNQLDAGVTEHDIIDQLMNQGIEEEDAVRETLFVSRTRQTAEDNKDLIEEQKKNKGPMTMGIGLGVAILGGVLTIALEGEVVFVGAIGIGLVVFFFGIYQSATYKKEEK